LDCTFGLEPYSPVSHDTLAWATRDRPRPYLAPPFDRGADTLWSTLLLRKLLENDSYRIYFINRFADLLNISLHPDRVIAKIAELSGIIAPDMPLEMARWSSVWGGTLEGWQANVEGLRDYARRRPQFIRRQIIDKFDLVDTASLTLEPPVGQGQVQVNTVTPDAYPWHGKYFQGVPVSLQAQPAPGYRFSGWSDPALPQSPAVKIALPEFYSVHAIFSRSDR